jgi:predicted protein tyrosine phosphatase
VKAFVLDHKLAEEFIPQEKALAIRIFDSYGPNDGSISLQDGWADILEYTFDDIELDRYSDEYLSQHLPEWKVKFDLFDTALAGKIQNDFSSYLDFPQVMVHCAFGWKRSPAVIKGLAHIFDLELLWGDDRTHRIMTHQGGWCGNTHVYKLLCEQKLKKAS